MFDALIRDKKFAAVIKKTAGREGVPEALLKNNLRAGTCIIPANKERTLARPCAIGRGLTTKVNVNIGASPDKSSLKTELQKLEVAVRLGADTVMDLSVGGDVKKIRRSVLERSPIPVGTVPIYEAALQAQKRKGSFLHMEAAEILQVLEEQAREGVDFFTVHCGINRRSVGVFLKEKRILDVVSRGGALLIHWMRHHNRENPLFERFDQVLAIARQYHVTLSLGDGMRPGSILDATDPVQIAELEELGRLARRCRQAGVQVMIEGPGHVPLNQIEKNIRLEKKICRGAPFYVLGPLVTDIGLGYDHISGAIGGALAAFYGADFLCFLTPSEHIRHPSVQDTREGLIASKIAAHAADIAKGIKGAADRDRTISLARKRRDWTAQIAACLDPENARSLRHSSPPAKKDVCTMCGDFCSIKTMEACLDK
jgi:phosphomethylpyrimidine synthase